MKNSTYSPYASFTLDKIEAPKPKRNTAPRSSVKVTGGDLRTKK